jgi:hypothetical protein
MVIVSVKMILQKIREICPAELVALHADIGSNELSTVCLVLPEYEDIDAGVRRTNDMRTIDYARRKCV